MATDWNAVLTQALAAAEESLAGNWGTVAPAASHSISLLIQTGQYISDHPELSEPVRKMLADNQKLAMKGVLLGYEDIGILAAEQAVAAAWSVVSQAITTAIGAAI